jgi:diguanylate cyclase (GGDEF)-like protein
MQDLDDDPRIGRRRLSAVQGERGTPTVTTQDASVVSAQRLLKVATALSDGATKLHAQLRHLDPAERDAILDAVAEQVTEIVNLWADLVRGVVSTDDEASAASSAAAERLGPRRAPPVTATREGGGAGDHPARVPTPDPVQPPAPQIVPEPARLSSEPDSVAPPGPSPSPVSSPASAVRHVTMETGRDSDRLTRDELTGVLNRQAGFAALGREIDRCSRSGERFVLGYLNVDRMKVVNDTRGSRAGDEILRKVTAALRATLRSYDVIARLGGDEFLFSLPGSDMATAEQRVKEFGAILSEEAPGSTASVGFADLNEHDTLDDLIAAAETAMLKGRRSRRRGRG